MVGFLTVVVVGGFRAGGLVRVPVAIDLAIANGHVAALDFALVTVRLSLGQDVEQGADKAHDGDKQANHLGFS